MALCLQLQLKTFQTRALLITLLDTVEMANNTLTYWSSELETYLRLKIEELVLVQLSLSAVISRRK